MGLGSKIKNALHGDDHRPVASNARAPGAYPSDEYLGKSGANDSFQNHTTKHTNPAGSTSGDNTLDSSASQHRKLQKDSVDDHGYAKDELSPKSATSQQSWDSGVGGVGKANTTKDRTSSGGYWGEMGQGNKSTTASKDLPDRSRYQSGSNATADYHHDPRLADQAAGGGVYNGVTGTGSHNHQDGHSNHLSQQGAVHDPLTSSTKGVTGMGSHNHQDSRSNRLSQQGAVHDPLTSSTRGVSGPSDDGYGENYVPENNMTSSQNQYSSRSLNGQGLNGRGLNGQGLNGRGLNGSGLNGRGATASHGAAGVGVGDDYGAQRGVDERDGYTYGDVPRDAGMPKSSMLDPEPATTATSSTHYNATPRAAGFSSSPTNERSTRHPSGPNNTSTTQSQSKKHFGPGHEGAKVMHQCEHCGNDNDISRYFNNDVVYRLGS